MAFFRVGAPSWRLRRRGPRPTLSSVDLVDEPKDPSVGLLLVELCVLVLAVANDVPDANLVLSELVAKIDDLAHSDGRIQDGREDRVSPSSMRFAISTSPSRVRSETLPILRRYIRTGSLLFE